MNRPHTKRRKTKAALALLDRFESRNVTYLDPDGSWPIVWDRARGTRVWDADGGLYLDLTAAFGVAAAGHANPRVVRAGQRQMGRLLHAMGDVHPHALKAQLARELSRLTFERWTAHSRIPSAAKTIFCNSGFEAVEAALKTGLLATGKPGIIAFAGAYHGLGYGALNATHRDHFRAPFRTQLRRFGHFVPFPPAGCPDPAQALAAVETRIRALCRRHPIGAIVVEPIQVRGGVHIPPAGFLGGLRRLCDELRAVLILDEIYTGFGRTGEWFAAEHEQAVPDLVCLGKALTGGFPLSACVGRGELMDAAWPPSTGEAIHTSTFLGHPVGCAMALAQLKEIARRRLVQRSAELGRFLATRLAACGVATADAPAGFTRIGSGPNAVDVQARGLGLLWGVEVRLANGRPATEISLRIVKTLLHRGYIFLPEGEHANVIGFTPPLTISRGELAQAAAALEQALREEADR